MKTDLDRRHRLIIFPGKALDLFLALPWLGSDNRRIGFCALPTPQYFCTNSLVLAASTLPQMTNTQLFGT